jgi:hypothetical protein
METAASSPKKSEEATRRLYLVLKRLMNQAARATGEARDNVT